MAKASSKRIFAISLVVLAAAFILYVILPPQRNLLARSRRLVWLPHDPSFATEGDPGYYWQTDKQIATVSFRDPDWAAESFDVDSRRKKPLSSLSPWVWLDDQWVKSFSPNGKWVLASVSHTAIIAQSGGKWKVDADDEMLSSHSSLIALSGGAGEQKSTQTIFNAVTKAFWLRDSRHWAILIHTHNGWFLEQHDLQQPKTVTQLPISHNLSSLLNIAFTSFHQFSVLSVTKDNQVLYAYNDYPDRSVAVADNSVPTLISIDLHYSPARVQKSGSSLPDGASLRGIVFSPDGERLAWLLNFDHRHSVYPSPWERFWYDYGWGSQPADPQPIPTEEIWVSRSDGSKMHELGHLAVANSNTRLSQLHWTPDGQQVSFVYNDYIYTTPVDSFWYK